MLSYLRTSRFSGLPFLMIFSKSLLEKLRNVHIAHWLGLDLKEGSLNRLGLIAGLTIPACAIPLIAVLLGLLHFLVGPIGINQFYLSPKFLQEYFTIYR